MGRHGLFALATVADCVQSVVGAGPHRAAAVVSKASNPSLVGRAVEHGLPSQGSLPVEGCPQQSAVPGGNPELVARRLGQVVNVVARQAAVFAARVVVAPPYEQARPACACPWTAVAVGHHGERRRRQPAGLQRGGAAVAVDAHQLILAGAGRQPSVGFV